MGPGSFEPGGKKPVSIGFGKMRIFLGYRLGYTPLALALIRVSRCLLLADPYDAIHQCFRRCRLNA